MGLTKKIKGLCAPAMLYLVVSIISIIGSIVQNFGNNKIYKMAIFSTPVPNNILIFIVKLICIAFWTWVLNLICKDGHTGIAWFLILIPFILLFIIMALIMVNPTMVETIKNKKNKK
jgi:hypothetical protein